MKDHREAPRKLGIRAKPAQRIHLYGGQYVEDAIREALALRMRTNRDVICDLNLVHIRVTADSTFNDLYTTA